MRILKSEKGTLDGVKTLSKAVKAAQRLLDENGQISNATLLWLVYAYLLSQKKKDSFNRLTSV
ncbi:MAG: hypothetical protein N3E41_05800 [Thermofilaceae archaeon]|nr:hypothetical protein [Thermofilaceae archaeon]